MGADNEPQRETPAIGYLVVASRVPIGVLGIGVVALFFLVWLILELVVALIAFPVAAVFANQAWIRGSWLGRFPISLREFARDGFKPIWVVWKWVTDPMESLDFDTGSDGTVVPLVGGSPSTVVEPMTPPIAEPQQSTWWDTALGCAGIIVIVLFCGGIIGSCNKSAAREDFAIRSDALTSNE